MKKTAFEGSSFSGKTTVSNELIKHNPDRYKLIQEYVVYAGGSDKFPPYPPKDKKEALSNLEFFLNLERKRHQDMEEFKGKPYMMVMDRSVITLLGFRYAQKYLIGLDVFTEARDIIKNEPELAPDFIFYMQSSDEDIASRKKESGRPVGDLFVDPEFNSHLRKFFRWLEDQKEYPIITIDTAKPIEQVKDEVVKLVDGLPVEDQA